MSRQDVAASLRQPLAEARFVLEDVSVITVGRRRVVKVLVDRVIDVAADDPTTPIEPLSLDDVADATRIVDAVLDGMREFDVGAYTLEVSSPGVGRPLTEHRHFRRNVGRLVDLTTADGDVSGRLIAVSPDALAVAVPAARRAAAHEVSVPVASVTAARVGIDFTRADTALEHPADEPEDLEDDDEPAAERDEEDR